MKLGKLKAVVPIGELRARGPNRQPKVHVVPIAKLKGMGCQGVPIDWLKTRLSL